MKVAIIQISSFKNEHGVDIWRVSVNGKALNESTSEYEMKVLASTIADAIRIVCSDEGVSK